MSGRLLKKEHNLLFCTNPNVPVGQQQVDDYIRGERVHAVEAFLDAPELLTQVLAAETLPCHTNLMHDRLPEVLAVITKSRQALTLHTYNEFNEAAS